MANKATKCCFNHFIRRFSTPAIPAYNFIPKAYTGPSIAKTDSLKLNHISPVVYDLYKKPLIIHQGSMQWLYDHEGRRYLDLFGGIVTVSVGHCHPWIGIPTQVYQITSFYPRLRPGLTSTQAYRQPNISHAGFYNALLPDPYRGIWGGCRDSLSQVPDACSCRGDCVTSDKYAHQLSELLENSVPAGRVAALFAESIQGVNGALQFPKGYLRKAYQLIKNYGGLYVADEVQTGFGRTGDTFWGFENQGFTPDIVTMAKGIGNGFPLAAVVTTKEIAAAHAQAAYFNTFGGNPLAAAAGKAVLEVIEEENLQENNKVMGRYFIEQLMELQKIHPVIGDVRGKGLMLGLDLIKPGTKEPMPVDQFKNIFETIKDLGVLIGRGGRWNNVLRIKPPMCINKQDVDFSISVLDEAFKRHKY
ncbi:Alanine--glyoxylate aminotransferase 2, mitochondrial [Papilio machaon]|uniref:Alanine--glyoxylate aminotransferase 2, mitochondrial n=1 Tax=Papilio machaon TaxID=76193 RepID=A0A0N1I7H1_PAPMA|nr:Alanine--glyoxylate aminotransferase 2, mitochondrial [Papilio machaon]